MSASEVASRITDQARRWSWRRRQILPDDDVSSVLAAIAGSARSPASPQFRATLPAGATERVPVRARQAVVASADQILAGRWEVLGVMRKDMLAPDWFFDPVTGRRAPDRRYCFSIDHRSEDVTGNVKQVWELSRLHHVTVLGAAYALTGNEEYAERSAQHLRQWWSQNPFLSGVHWTSGIEIGLRLIAWVWARRLLEGWAGASALFEENDLALTQIWWHQRYLSTFRSSGSSANNHVIAEAAGQLVASLAFPWFPESERWAVDAASLLERELVNNTFPSGLNREMAFDYHGFVAELALVAGAEADLAGRPLSDRYWQTLIRMLDAGAAVLDVRGQEPRYGDGDDGRALVMDSGTDDRWPRLLATGHALADVPPWWSRSEPDAVSSLLACMIERRHHGERPSTRPPHFEDAGLTILRHDDHRNPEIWCRCDAGPHGFLSIAAHAHADALSLEVRHDGMEILADPGTYCYHGEPEWRDYFRSTIGHNTIEVAGRNQSLSGGSFLWRRHARSRLLDVVVGGEGEVTEWLAEHDGYLDLDPSVVHRRRVRLWGATRRLEIRDTVLTRGGHPVRIGYHLGPDVAACLMGAVAELSWRSQTSVIQRATLELPLGVKWHVVTGGTDPVAGWYSPRFGQKQPTVTLIGVGQLQGDTEFLSVLQFHDHLSRPPERSTDVADTRLPGPCGA